MGGTLSQKLKIVDSGVVLGRIYDSLLRCDRQLGDIELAGAVKNLKIRILADF
jgi:hypothetical protein